MSFDIVGFDSSWKVPYFAVQLNYAAGPIEGQGALDCLLIGLPGTGGNIVNDSEIRQVFQQSDVDDAVRPGSQLSRMGKAAFAAVPSGANIYIAAVSEPAGAAATFTGTVTGAWSAAGSIKLTIAGVDINVTIGATDTIGNVATNIANAMSSKPDLPFVGSPAAGVVTGTCVSKGAQGNSWIIAVDVSLAPTGFVFALAGSSTIRSNIHGVTTVFAGATLGAGVEDYTTILTKLTTKRWARIACGANDATNAALVRAFIRQQLAPLVQKYNMAIFGHNGTQASVTSLAQTTLNDPNCQVVAQRYSEAHPAEIAAGVAALRASVEGDDPVPDYDGMSPNGHGDFSAWMFPSRFTQDAWLDSEANALLNAGVTPVQTMGNAAKCTRAITTYCLLGSGQDERCLDIGDAVMPAYAAIALQNLYWSQFRAANKYVRDNPLPQEPEPPSGVGYPKLWDGTLKKQLQVWYENGWIQHTWDVNDSPSYPFSSAFNKAAQRIQSGFNMVVFRIDHQLGQTINQTGPS